MPQSTHRDQYPDSGGIGFDRYRDRARPQGPAKNLAARFDEIVIRLDGEETSREKDIIEVEMPLGLYTSYNVSATRAAFVRPRESMGVLDVQDLFLDPCRVQAA